MERQQKAPTKSTFLIYLFECQLISLWFLFNDSESWKGVYCCVFDGNVCRDVVQPIESDAKIWCQF